MKIHNLSDPDHQPPPVLHLGGTPAPPVARPAGRKPKKARRTKGNR